MKTLSGKLKQCKACGNDFTPFKPFQPCCAEPACMIEVARMKRETKAKKERRQMKKDFRAKDRPYQMKLTQAVVNRYVVHVKEKGKGCYTCDLQFGDNKLGGVIDCGHGFARGSRPDIALDIRHLRRQCVPCNRHHAGRPAIFKARLIEELGQDEVDDILKHGPKMTCAELIELRAHYSKLIRDSGL